MNTVRWPNGTWAPTNWIEIQSSFLVAGAYTTTRGGRLYIEFIDGAVYRYDDVPSDALPTMIASGLDPQGSAGRCLNDLKREYPCQRIM